MNTTRQPLLQMQDIHVSYENVKALENVDFDLYPGEIHALVGSHRAGKSSLVKVLSGVVQRDAGEVVLRGRSITRLTIKSAVRRGIGMIYQEPSVVPVLSTLENICLGHARAGWHGRVDWREKREEILSLCRKYDICIRLKRMLSQNTLYEQNLVEFLHVFVQQPDIMILDELSSRFNPVEMEKIYPMVFDMKRNGKGVIYISHNIDEILRIADRVTVLKDGAKLGTDNVKGLNKMHLLKLTYSSALSREELEAENLQLLHLKKYNEDILRNIPIGVIIVNESNMIHLLNDAALRILEISPGVRVDGPVSSLLTGKDFPRKREFLRRFNSKECFSFEKLAYGPNKTLRVTAIPFRDEAQSPLGTILLIEDITKELSLMEYLLRVEKVSSIAELAAGVAHEINNPLGIVQNYVDILKVSRHDADSQSKLTKIEGEIARIAGIVKGLLSFTKSAALELSPVDVGLVVREVMVLLEHRLNESHAEIELREPQCRFWCMGDENRLKQLFMNLMVNSLEAGEPGVSIRIELSQDSEREAVTIAVADNGPGIPPDVRNRIFDPFFSTKARKVNAGLGLSICQHIVELHRGTISCESEPERSTCFRVTLPTTAGKFQKGSATA